ncbi:hypothetical protein BV898_18013 [Hypsibius exemplaris]|uniref:Metalloendopeptidase n=1 Tax=Hypsibius exemplaris TaxID=2072580 RepID=A0A9X6NGG3_HYPEX|nr:hypothetical protein BV898_18013 [Hypsibius exemplaris]
MAKTVVMLLAAFATAVSGQQDWLNTVGLRADKSNVLRAGGVVLPVSGRHNFWSWPGGVVPYYIDPVYTDEEKAQIKKAISAVQRSLSGPPSAVQCIRFEEVNPNSSKFKIKITPFKQDGVTKEQYCSSYPGIYKPFLASKRTEERVVLATGENGCFDGSQRSLMKIFTIILGKRNEHQRPDRNKYLTFNPENVQPGIEVAYRLHPKESFLYLCDYDYCSITHNQPSDFAKPGTFAFTVKNAPHHIPKLDKLSGCDCQELTELYRCKTDVCDFWDCEAQVPPSDSDVPLPPVEAKSPTAAAE